VRASPAITVFAAALFAASSASAQVRETENTRYYAVRGQSVSALLAEMAAKGPDGFWAYSNWYVNWSGSCDVTLEIIYTLPRWDDRAAASAELRGRWDRMITALVAHERQHAEHGRRAAHEIAADGCENDPSGIVDKWAAEDRAYDQRTEHGWSEGVVFEACEVNDAGDEECL